MGAKGLIEKDFLFLLKDHDWIHICLLLFGTEWKKEGGRFSNEEKDPMTWKELNEEPYEKDVRSNEATTKYLLMGGASSSILVHGFSWLYGSSGGEIELQEIVNGLINTQMYNSPGISIALIFITVGIGFKLSPAPSHQWTPDVYEGVRFVR
ncbi:hypothetical protein AHAS_Ahas12G0279400 [Arachis hypogaea]